MTDLPESSDSHSSVSRLETIKHLAYAEAAIMLLESLMLKLIEHRLLSSAQLVGAVEDAISTKRQMIHDGEHPEISAVASGLLRALANSLAAAK
jgi:hypothetical protein